MGRGGGFGWPPVGAPASLQLQREDHWRHFDSSVNAVSFGFVATAILISMFLVMAIFERFLRPNSSAGRRRHDLDSQIGFNGKLGHPSPKMTVYANGVSVLMPGDHVPSFIAHPAPIPCPSDQTSSHHQPQPSSPSTNSSQSPPS